MLAFSVTAQAPVPAVSDDGARVVRSYPSAFGTVYVVDEGRVRSLRFDDPDAADQSVLDLNKPDDVALEYVRVAALSLALSEAPKRVLVIGMGGGTFTRMVRRHVAGARTDAVEIDPVVADVAKRWFGVVEDARTRVHVTDGAAFLASARTKYDVIFLDAYDGEDFPAHLATDAFFALVRERLTKGGVAVMNLAVEDEEIAGRIWGRWQRAFPACLRVREPAFGNILGFGRKAPFPSSPSELLSRARAADRAYRFSFHTETFARSATGCDVPSAVR
jgi:spermidine synthase